jgi:hypothetical protein
MPAPFRTAGPARLVAGLAVTAATASTVAPNVARAATAWTVGVAAGSAGLAQSQPATPPATVTATCTSPATAKTITVTWSPVPHATYTVWESTTSATAGFTQVATGLTATTWTSGALKVNRSYWYEVSATIGGAWSTASSAATAPITINNRAPFC